MEALGEAARRACHVQGEDTSPLARQELVSVRLKNANNYACSSGDPSRGQKKNRNKRPKLKESNNCYICIPLITGHERIRAT